jgi:hypothetical protein
MKTHDASKLAALGAAEKKKLAAEGKKLIARVKALRSTLQRASFDLGRALARLKDSAIWGALGYKSFRALCDTTLHISVDLADELIAIAQSFSAREAKKLGTAKAVALIDLAKALPGEHTPAGLLGRGSVKVGKRTLDVKVASAYDLANEARAIRAAHPTPSRRGVHVEASERHLAAALDHALAHHGVEAKVSAIAAGKATGARIRIELPMRDLTVLARSIREARA